MNKVNIKKITLASGVTGAIIYLSCFILMSIFPREVLIKIANMLFHGIDFTKIIRMNIPLTETMLGIIVSFIFWGIVGSLLAFIYSKINK